MCGIVGFIGKKNAKEVLLEGLEKLEYRGYDSAGIALKSPTGVLVAKEKGRIADLRSEVPADAFGEMGIGHTRWATHGKQVMLMHIHIRASQGATRWFTMALSRTIHY